MTNTLISVQVDPDVNDFLEHFGIKGMHWGVRKARGVSVGTANRVRSTLPSRGAVAPGGVLPYRQRRAVSGQTRLDRYDGNTKRAILHLAGTQIAEGILTRSAQIAVKRIPNPTVRAGADIALELGFTALTIRNVNEGIKVTEASSANKKNSSTRRR